MKTRLWMIGLTITFLSTMTQLSYAHEKRIVGKYEFVVGFVNEPAFSSQMNGVDLRITTKSKPVEELDKTLKVTILTPDEKQSLEVALEPKYKEPGKYAGYFLPTRPGKYIFIVEGEIEGTAIKERFESGDKFHDVKDVEPLRFPKI